MQSPSFLSNYRVFSVLRALIIDGTGRRDWNALVSQARIRDIAKHSEAWKSLIKQNDEVDEMILEDDDDYNSWVNPEEGFDDDASSSMHIDRPKKQKHVDLSQTRHELAEKEIYNKHLGVCKYKTTTQSCRKISRIMEARNTSRQFPRDYKPS